MKVERALAEADRALASAQAQARGLIAAGGRIELVPAASAQPARVALQFSSPTAYRGAWLLGAYDDFARAVLTARYLGLVDTAQADELLRQGARPVRRVFQSPLGYRPLAVTRTDLAQGTAKAERARAAMGEVPEDILAGTVRAAFASGPARSDAGPLAEPAREPVALGA